MRDNPQLALKLRQRRRQTSDAGRSLANVARQQRQADLIGNGLGDSQQRVPLVTDPAFISALTLQPSYGPATSRPSPNLPGPQEIRAGGTRRERVCFMGGGTAEAPHVLATRR